MVLAIAEETTMTQGARTEEPADATQPGQAPEHKVHYGRVDVAVWRRQADDGRAWYGFTVSRSYKDRDDRWQRTTALDEEDLLPAAKALERAYDWVQQQRQAGRDGGFKELRGPTAPGAVS
jgi:hypothetical protein